MEQEQSTSIADYYKSLFATFLNFMPGVVILIFGMIALHSSLLLIQSHEKLSREYALVTQESLSFHGNGETINQALLLQTQKRGNQIGKRLYWSVIFLGLSGFVLVLLNADKLRKVSTFDDEKKGNLNLLENRLQAMEAAMDGIAIIDSRGLISYMNKAMFALHGITPDQSRRYIGAPWVDLYNEAGRENIESNALPILEEKGFWHEESLLFRKDEKIVHAEFALTRLKDGGIIGTARDITKRKQAEKEREEIQQQFFQAQKMEAIGRLAGGIAHDFNNILAAMNGYAEFLVDDLDKETPQNKFAQNILKAGAQARSLVDQMLAFSRIKSDDLEAIDLVDSIDETLSILKASLPKSIELKTNIALDNGIIDGNSTQISQVLMNLCVNARDAIESDKGTIEIALNNMGDHDFAQRLPHLENLPSTDDMPPVTIEEDPSGLTQLLLGHIAKGHDYLVLSVSDTGSGMGKNTMEHVFEPFFTTKSIDKGTGLGLSTVHGVLRSHKAAMIINSEIGTGTTFFLLFPLSQNQVKINKKYGTQINKNQKLSGHILLVEDQDEVADVTSIMLERIGLSSKRCASGLEALDELRENRDAYDIVLTDQNMPQMTGIELLYEIQYDDINIPFILLSGYSEEKLQEMMEEHPDVKGFLRKPVKQENLYKQLAAALENIENLRVKNAAA